MSFFKLQWNSLLKRLPWRHSFLLTIAFYSSTWHKKIPVSRIKQKNVYTILLSSYLCRLLLCQKSIWVPYQICIRVWANMFCNIAEPKMCDLWQIIFCPNAHQGHYLPTNAYPTHEMAHKKNRLIFATSQQKYSVHMHFLLGTFYINKQTY